MFQAKPNLIQILIYGILMKKHKRMGNIKNDKSSNIKQKFEDDIDFMLWKMELNTELLSFWKSIVKSNKE